MNEKTIIFGETVYANASKMPQLEIKYTIYGDERVLYLSPFRGYSFQVSGSIEGSGSYGASSVVGLGNIVNIKPSAHSPANGYSAFSSNITSAEYGKEFMYGLAVTALYKFAVERKLIPASIGGWGSNSFDRFIDECYAYIIDITKSYR